MYIFTYIHRCINIHENEQLPYVSSCGLDRHARVHNYNTGKLIHKQYLKQRLTAIVMTNEGAVIGKKQLRQNKKEQIENGTEGKIYIIIFFFFSIKVLVEMNPSSYCRILQKQIRRIAPIIAFVNMYVHTYIHTYIHTVYTLYTLNTYIHAYMHTL